MPKSERSIYHPAFMGSYQTINHTFFCLVYKADEFSFKEIRTWG